jgi:hypothetical protein
MFKTFDVLPFKDYKQLADHCIIIIENNKWVGIDLRKPIVAKKAAQSVDRELFWLNITRNDRKYHVSVMMSTNSDV